MGARITYVRGGVWAYVNYGPSPTYFSKVITDAFTPTDSIRKTLGKSLADSVTIGDTFNRVVVYSRPFADSFTPIDAAALTTTKRFTESQSFSDVMTRAVTKALADSVTMGDSGFVGTSSYCDPTYMVSLADYVATTYRTF